MYGVALLRTDTELFQGMRRSVVGAFGWTLMALGAAALITPIPFAFPALLAGAALVEDTNPKLGGPIVGAISDLRRRITGFGLAARSAVCGVLTRR